MSDRSLPDGWETVIGLEVHSELATATKLFCGCPNQLRRRAQHQHLPGVPRPARLAAGAQRAGRRAGHAPRPGAALRGAAVGLRPEELLLSGHAEGLPGQPVRPADQRRRPARPARRACGSASRGPTSRRTPASRPTSAAAAASTTPTTPSSTTTAPASRSSRSCREPDIRSAEQAKEYVDELRAILLATGVSDAKMEEGSMRVDANVSVRPRRRAVGHPLRDQEPQLAALARAGPSTTRRAARSTCSTRGETRPPGDPPLGRGRRAAPARCASKEEADDYRYFPEPDLVPARARRAEDIAAHRRRRCRAAGRPPRPRWPPRPASTPTDGAVVIAVERGLDDLAARRHRRRRRRRPGAHPRRAQPRRRGRRRRCRPSTSPRSCRWRPTASSPPPRPRRCWPRWSPRGGDPGDDRRRRKGFEAMDAGALEAHRRRASSPPTPTSGSSSAPATTRPRASSPASSWARS